MLLLIRGVAVYLLLYFALMMLRHGPWGGLTRWWVTLRRPTPAPGLDAAAQAWHRAVFAHTLTVALALLLLGGHVAAWLWPDVGLAGVFVPLWGQLIPLAIGVSALLALRYALRALLARLGSGH